MSSKRQYYGFSLIEVLLAVATLAIGMIFIGGTFLVGIHLSGVSAERTTAVIVANEAFSKIRIFGVDMGDPNLAIDRSIRYRYEAPTLSPFAYDEFAYPSTRTLANKQYFWSALCRRDPNDPDNVLQVTVFVCRKIGSGARYRDPSDPFDPSKWIDRPVVLPVGVSKVSVDPAPPVLAIEAGKERWISPGYTIVEDSTGAIYRVVGNGVGPDEINLDPAKPWPWPGSRVVWVVPPAIGHGKGPCIDVYQQGDVRF